jgi:hypothetical protein
VSDLHEAWQSVSTISRSKLTQHKSSPTSIKIIWTCREQLYLLPSHLSEGKWHGFQQDIQVQTPLTNIQSCFQVFCEGALVRKRLQWYLDHEWTCSDFIFSRATCTFPTNTQKNYPTEACCVVQICCIEWIHGQKIISLFAKVNCNRPYLTTMLVQIASQTEVLWKKYWLEWLKLSFKPL